MKEVIHVPHHSVDPTDPFARKPDCAGELVNFISSEDGRAKVDLTRICIGSCFHLA